MTSVRWGRRATSRAALVATLLAWALRPGAARAQVEVRAAEREAELAGIEVGEVPLERHLLSRHEIALWLPEGWTELPSLGGRRSSFTSDDGLRTLTVGSAPVPPGAGLLSVLGELLDSLDSVDFGADVDSVRRFRLAGRDAFEVAGSKARDDRRFGARLVLSVEPDGSRYQLLVLRGPDEPDDPLDAAYARLIRDWTPLGAGAWSRSLEILRESVIDDRPSVAWAERNRLFDAMARPEAVSQPWFDERLREMAGENPLLLLDGVFHHHPRVRIGCLEALDPAALDEPVRTGVFAAALTDPDPAVRFRAARRIADDTETAPFVLARLLETDSEAARAGAFQLLAITPEASRAKLVSSAFTERRQYPEASLPFLAATLAEWGEPDEAARLLRAAWKRSRHDVLERSAWLELLGLGDSEALAAARRRLAQPLEPGPLPLGAAATAVAAHAEPGDLEPWRRLAAGLEPAPEDGEPEGGAGESDEEVAAARAVLGSLVGYLESLPEAPSPADQCEALERVEDRPAWVAARRRELACPPERTTGRMRASIPRPGPYFFALLDLLGRLEVGSAVHNQAFHSLLDRLDRLVDDWAGDPITAESTGVGLDSPWRVEVWGSPTRSGEPADGAATGGATLRLSSTDPARLLDTLLRTSSGRLDLTGLAQGMLSTSALPLLPLGVVAMWSNEQEVETGTDSGGSTPAPVERYLALGATEPRGEGELRVLYALEVDGDGSDWHLAYLVRRGAEVVLTDAGEPPSEASDPEPSAARTGTWNGAGLGDGEPTAWSRLEIDLGDLLEHDAPEGLRERLGEIAEGDLSFTADTTVELDVLATAFRLDGLAEEWLSLAENVPAQELRAPRELLPENCVTWAGLSLSPSRLAARLRAGSPKRFADLPRRRRARLLDLVDHLGGEAGVAVVGAPDPRGEKVGEAWQRRVVGYLTVEPAAADRFLRRAAQRHDGGEGPRVYRLRDTFLARVGGFLVAASNPEVLAALGRPPFLAAGALYGQVAAHGPADAVLRAGWDTDRLADVVAESIQKRGEGEASTFSVEIFRAFGDITAWVRRSDAALVGELATRPRLQSEATQARVRRLTGYGDLIQGSVGAHGLPRQTTDGLDQDVLEVTLRLPEELPELDLDWANQRLDQELLAPGTYRFVSRAAAALPEESDVTLPMTDPHLLPFTRNEHNLEIHSAELRALAETIRGDEEDPARIVRAIVAWAHERLDYTVIQEAVSTEQILATRQADCTEFSQLTISLARSLGIPARPVHGAYVGGDGAYFHRWAEVFLDRWYEVDPTWGIVQVPATNLRIPVDDGRFLASLPGVRFTGEAITSTDGGFARRLPGGPAPTPDGPTDLAIDGDRVLIALPSATGAPAGDHGGTVLYSGDGGHTFADLSPPDAVGEAVRLLGGHGRIVWLYEAGGASGGLAAHELGSDGAWRRLRLPPALRTGESWTVGLHPGGYLALAGDGSNLLAFDRGLALESTVALPREGAGEWVLAQEGGLLARSVEGEGITLYRWSGEGWTAAADASADEIADTADLTAVDVRQDGDRVLVVSRHRPTGQLILLGIDGTTVTRRSFSSEEARAFATVTRAGDAEWTLWVSGRDRVLTRRPVG